MVVLQGGSLSPTQTAAFAHISGGVSGLAGSTQLQAFLTIFIPIYQLITYLYQIKNLKFDPKQYGKNKHKGSCNFMTAINGLIDRHTKHGRAALKRG